MLGCTPPRLRRGVKNMGEALLTHANEGNNGTIQLLESGTLEFSYTNPTTFYVMTEMFKRYPSIMYSAELSYHSILVVLGNLRDISNTKPGLSYAVQLRASVVGQDAITTADKYFVYLDYGADGTQRTDIDQYNLRSGGEISILPGNDIRIDITRASCSIDYRLYKA